MLTLQETFDKPIFAEIADGYIEIIGLPLWRNITIYDTSNMNSVVKTGVVVYVKIVDFLPWIDSILNNRCHGCRPPYPVGCEELMFFSKDC